MIRRSGPLVATAVAAALVLSACGGAAEDVSNAAAAPAAPAAPAGGPLDLSGVCPETVVLQQDWQPEAEHGAMYSLVGSDYTVDADAKSVTGSLVAQGVDTGVKVEVRPGGPNVGFQPVPALMYLDDSITLGAVNTDAAIVASADQPTVAVASQMTVSPQILMWDPASHPGMTTIRQVAAERFARGDRRRRHPGAAGEPGHHQGVAVRHQLRGHARAVRVRPGDHAAGLRHGRAVRLPERDRGVGPPGGLRAAGELRLLDLPRAARRARRQAGAAAAVPGEAGADHAAGADRLPRRSRPDQPPDRPARGRLPDRVDLLRGRRRTSRRRPRCRRAS